METMLLKQSSSVPHCFSDILYESKMRLLDIIFLLIFINPVAQAEIECDAAVPPEHGTVNIFDDEFKVGSMVEYTCDEGRILVGSASSRCLETGKWTSPPPRCLGLTSVKCPKFDDRDFVIYYAKEQAVNSTAVFVCKDPRKRIDGTQIVTCLSNGQWSGSPPNCKISCNVKDLEESEDIVPNDKMMVLDGEYLDVRCREGYSPSGQQARCSRGQWNVTGKLCKETLLLGKCTVHRIDNGYFLERLMSREREYIRLSLGEIKNPGSTVYVSCDESYTFQGKHERLASVTCSEGKWHPDPVCLLPQESGQTYRTENITVDSQYDRPTSVKCPKFDDRDFVIYYDKEQAVNSTAVFACKDPNKRIDWTQRVTCLSNGQWSGNPPNCKSLTSVKCPKFDDRDFVIYYDKEQAVNSTAVFSCKDPRKRIDGTQIVTCLSTGKWSGSPPNCKMDCPKINETKGMTVSYSKGLVEGSIASFHCLAPRILYGVSSTTCQSNGIWMNPWEQNFCVNGYGPPINRNN